ncbi:cysteine hydrolase [candidate division WOR-3 bacterium]|nr:cysteine hydrolase [candidate division WOR-3 bacterium]
MKEAWFFVAFFMMVPFLFAQTSEPEESEKREMKPALLVIDIQNRYLPMMAQDEKDLALRVINGAIWLFRQHNLPVIRVYDTDLQFGPKPDEEDFQFPSSIIIQDDDPMVIKNFPSAFKNTELETILQEKDVNTVFLCGLSAVGCVLATYYGAMDRDFDVFMIKNAIMSHNSEYTGVIKEITDAVTFKTLQFMLEHMQK